MRSDPHEPLHVLFACCLSLGALAIPAAGQSGIVTRGALVLDSRWTHESFVELCPGVEHSLARRADGTVVGWGENTSGECTVPEPPTGTAYVALAAGGAYVCSFDCLLSGFSAARRSDGVVVVWGDDSDAQHSVPALPAGQSFVGLWAGSHLLALRSDGALVAWGDNSKGQCNVPPAPGGLMYVEGRAGWSHSLGLLSDGRAVGWGFNDYGQCDVPALPPGEQYVQIAAGYNHSVALRSNGTVVAWGLNSSGCCDVPAAPAGLHYVEVAAGYGDTLARLSDGTLVARGFGAMGSLDLPPPPPGRVYVGGSVGMGLGAGRTHVEAGGVNYCTSSPNSSGCASTIHANGSASLAVNQLGLSTDCMPDGIYVYFLGDQQQQTPFGNGVLCVGGNVVRIPLPGLAAGGLAQATLNLPSLGIDSPGTRNFQCWFRDLAAGAAGFDASDAIAITFVP